MKISYGTLAKAVYIELGKEKVAKIKESTPGAFLDLIIKKNL